MGIGGGGGNFSVDRALYRATRRPGLLTAAEAPHPQLGVDCPEVGRPPRRTAHVRSYRPDSRVNCKPCLGTCVRPPLKFVP